VSELVRDEVALDGGAQRALRDLIAAEPLTQGLQCAERILLDLALLIPCDAVGVAVADGSGHLLDEVCLPREHPLDASVCDGPLLLGVQVWSRDPEHRDDLRSSGLVDGVAVGFRTGRGHVVQVYLDRARTPFSERDLRLIHLVTPALDRIFRRQPTSRLPHSITPSERRVLQLVAVGYSNAEVASRVGVAPSTVRKHLEHAYRKLGVSNRLAAVVRFEGSAPTGSDLHERIERFA
jgi:DNA-binding CsgD family transcriptional regulator